MKATRALSAEEFELNYYQVSGRRGDYRLAAAPNVRRQAKGWAESAELNTLALQR